MSPIQALLLNAPARVGVEDKRTRPEHGAEFEALMADPEWTYDEGRLEVG